MDKIVFEDLPSKNTPLNAENLNKLQQNIEDAIRINTGIKELVGTSDNPIDLNDITDVGIYKVVEEFYTNAYYVSNLKPSFMLFVTGSPATILTQAIITASGLAIRTRVYLEGSYTWSEWGLTGTTGGDTLPIGIILPFAGETAPDNYLICKGQELPRVEFRELFNVIGTTYGEGDGSTTFLLPKQFGKVLVGKDTEDTDFDTLGKIGGEKTHKLTVNEIPSHNHAIGVVLSGSKGGDGNLVGGNDRTGTAKDVIDSIGGSQPHNNLQPYMVTNFIIKVKMSASLTGQVIDSLDSDSTTDAPSINAVNKALKTNITTGQEFKTGRVIDGKEEYGLRVDIGALPNATTKDVELDLDLTSVQITKVEGMAVRSTDYNSFPLPFPSNAENYSIPMNPRIIDGISYLQIQAGIDRSNCTGKATIYYTKN